MSGTTEKTLRQKNVSRFFYNRRTDRPIKKPRVGRVPNFMGLVLEEVFGNNYFNSSAVKSFFGYGNLSIIHVFDFPDLNI